MSLSRVDETDLLIPLHDGPHETPRWATFLRRLRRRTLADAATLILHHHGPRSAGRPEFAVLSSPEGRTPPSFSPFDLPALRPDRVYSGAEIDGGSTQAHPHLRIVRLREPGGAMAAWLTIARASDDFGAADSAMLAALAPHFSVALRNLAALERERDRVRIASILSARLGAGWVLLDSELRVLDTDEMGGHILRDRLGMTRLAGERLHVTAEDARTLAQIGASLGKDSHAEARIVPPSGTLPLALLLMPAATVQSALLPQAALIGVMRIDPEVTRDRASSIATLFGLPLSEARLAASLANGAGIAEAATTLGLTIETARNYSKRVYAKTGTTGQANLVRLILSSVAMLA